MSDAGRILTIARPLADALGYTRVGVGPSGYSLHSIAWFDDPTYKWDGKPFHRGPANAKCLLVNARGFVAYSPEWAFWYTEDSLGSPMFYSVGSILDLDDIIQNLSNNYPLLWGPLLAYYVAHPNRRHECLKQEKQSTTTTRQEQTHSPEQNHVPKFGDSSFLLRRKRSQDKLETR